ncbi:MAG: Trk system potassium transporter TrkA [Clostridia bacterium]|nr:Trk system potassium transporter TrkA [Clostridia bacterium]
MKIIVVGCGKIGMTLIENLVSEGHDVVAIDNEPTVLAEVTNVYDVISACGNGTDGDLLMEADVKSTDLFIAVTGSDELNMLSCFIAKRMGAKHTVARIRNPEHNDGSLDFLRQELELSLVVNPERLVAQELYNMLKLPSAVRVETFSGRGLEMVELKLKTDSPLDGMKLMDLRKKYSREFLICMVQREDSVFIPDGAFELKSGDKIGIIATPSEILKLLKDLGILHKQARNVMILGASNTAYYLSKMLLSGGNSVKIVDKNEARCRAFSEGLPEAVIIHGDGAQQELLLEEGISDVDAFVSLTGMDEQNILISYFAQSRTVPKVITKVNRGEFSVLAEQLGLDSIVSPRQTVANVIVRYARALENSLDSSVETLYKLAGGSAEALEFTVHADAPLCNIPLKDLQLKPNTLIAGITRGHENLLPSGNDAIRAGDKVLILTSGSRVRNLSDILGNKQ